MANARDIAALSDALLELHAQPTLSDVAACTVRSIESLIPCDWASVSQPPSPSDPASRPRFWSVKRDQQQATVAQSAAFYREHPMWNRWWSTLTPACVELTDLIPAGELQHLGVQHEVFRPLAIANMLGGTTARSCPLAIVAVRDRRRAFTARDRAIVRAIIDHAGAAAERLADAEHRAQHTEFVALDALDRPVRWSPAAATLLGLAPADRSLPAAVRRWLADRADAPRTTPSTLRLAVRTPTGPRTLAITALTARGPDPTILAIESFAAEPHTPLADLTDRQREIARWVAAGKTNPEIAAILGISARTVQKHLEHIFERLAVPTRSALTAAVLAPDTRAPAV
jgi:DNA-binding CsgD family transcriptional regulator